MFFRFEQFLFDRFSRKLKNTFGFRLRSYRFTMRIMMKKSTNQNRYLWGHNRNQYFSIISAADEGAAGVMIINHCHTHARIKRERERENYKQARKRIHRIVVDERGGEKEGEEKNTQWDDKVRRTDSEKDLDCMLASFFFSSFSSSRRILRFRRLLVSQWYALTHTQRPSTIITRTITTSTKR